LIDRATAIGNVEEFLRRFTAMDFASLRQLLADDMTAQATYSDVYPDIRSGDGFIKYMSTTVLGFVQRINFIVDAMFFDADLQTVVAEFHNRGQRVDGRPYENDYVWIFTFRGELISGLKIYYNPVRSA
jgi:ketosteroid isomerase-like protein